MSSASTTTSILSLLPRSSHGRGHAHHRLTRHGFIPVFHKTPVKLAVKAMVDDRRDSLDHLQRATKARLPQEPQQRSTPKGGVAPSRSLGLWDRFPTARNVQQMMETMERIMEDPFAYSGTFPSLSGEEHGSNYRRGRTPWEIKEGDGVYKMRFDMPGMTKNDVKVRLDDNILVIKAEKLPKQVKEGEAEEEEEWSVNSYGRYNTTIALPENIDLAKITAEVKDGVLYVAVPKASPSSKVLDISVQ